MCRRIPRLAFKLFEGARTDIWLQEAGPGGTNWQMYVSLPALLLWSPLEIFDKTAAAAVVAAARYNCIHLRRMPTTAITCRVL